MNRIVFGGGGGGARKEKKKCPGDPAETFCKCELEQMNIAFVLPGRRDGAQAVWRRGGEYIKDGLEKVQVLVPHDARSMTQAKFMW